MELKNFKWTRQPKDFKVEDHKISVLTKPFNRLTAKNILSLSK